MDSEIFTKKEKITILRNIAELFLFAICGVACLAITIILLQLIIVITFNILYYINTFLIL